jgi:hypothetical protein
VTVLVEGCLPFEDVIIGASPAAARLTTPATAIASQDGEMDGLAVDVTKVARSAGGLLDVQVRYRNTGSAALRMPNAASAKERRFASMYVIDNASRKKFEVSREGRGRALGSESIELGGSFRSVRISRRASRCTSGPSSRPRRTRPRR